MPIDRKRRIFRAGPLAPPRRGLGRRPTLAAGIAAVAIVGGTVLLSLPAALFGRVPAGPQSLQAAASLVAVVDGETLRLGDQVVRLRGVAAPPRGQLCEAADGRRFDCGAAAATGLAALLRGRGVDCRLEGRDASGMALATCAADGTDLNVGVITGGWARAALSDPALTAAEAQARAAHQGLWATTTF